MLLSMFSDIAAYKIIQMKAENLTSVSQQFFNRLYRNFLLVNIKYPGK